VAISEAAVASAMLSERLTANDASWAFGFLGALALI
jgi:hypothetical protein